MELSTIPLPGENRVFLKEVIVRLILPGERLRWEDLLKQHHYLGFTGMVGKSLRYVAEHQGRWLALLGWQSAALKCKPRDQWIGWSSFLQYQRLSLIANNTRFLILPDITIKNLASRILSLNLKRLSSDWQMIHGHPLLLAETFVDPNRFTAASYRAANWQRLGLTRGFAKHQKTYTQHNHPKWVLVYPLHPKACQRLQDPAYTFGEQTMKNPNTMTPKQWRSLYQQLRALPDCRKHRGIRHSYRTILTIAMAAVVCGAKSFAALSEFAALLTQAQLQRLYARFNKTKGCFAPPSESALRRTLQVSDADALDQILGQWLFAQSDPKDPIAIDGKTLRGARRKEGSHVHLLSAFLHQQAMTIAQIEVGEKTNEIPELKRLLTPIDITGRIITADALHTQQETARYIVEEKKAHYLFTVKENQKTLLEDIAALGPDDFFLRESPRRRKDTAESKPERFTPQPPSIPT